RRHDVPLQHVKAHGSLSNMADKDPAVAEAILVASLAVVPEVPNMVKPGTAMHRAAEAMGAPYILEVYADRAYHEDLTLVSRKQPGAVIQDPQEAAERVVRMVVHGKVITLEGTEVDLRGDTVCVHGDTPGAVAIARAVRERLEAAGEIGRAHV